MTTHRLILPAMLLTLILFQTNQPARAGSATWNLNPTSGDWNTGRTETLTFGVIPIITRG